MQIVMQRKKTQVTMQKDSINSNARELEQHKNTRTIMQDE
jgi:hypothetical protein